LISQAPEAQDVAQTFQYNDGESKEKMEDVMKKFRKYTEPKANTVMERYEFWAYKRKSNENLDIWITELRKRAERCEFGDQKESMIRDKLVFEAQDANIKTRLLRETQLTLTKAIELTRTAEVSLAQVKKMNEGEKAENTTKIHAVRSKEQHKKHPGFKKKSEHAMPPRTCTYCATVHQPRKCPAYGKVCGKCHGKNHFASACKTKMLHALEGNQDDDQLILDTLTIDSVHADWFETLQIGKHQISTKLDTGASQCDEPQRMGENQNIRCHHQS
jgi:hypothetical protein